MTTPPRHCFLLRLEPGQAERYDALHRDMPPEVAQEIAAAGFRNYTMFRHEDTVVGYAEDVDDMTGALAALARSDAYTRWAQQFDGVFASGEDCDTVGSDVRICGEVWHLRHE